MNYLIDKFFIYLTSAFKGRLPFKYKDTYIIEDTWVIHYECLSVDSLDVSEAIKSSIRIKYSDVRNKFYSLNVDEKDFKDLFEKTLKAFVCLDHVLKNQSIFYNYFKLQDYSEYKKERRDSIINNLIN
jgi:hypothetical protein